MAKKRAVKKSAEFYRLALTGARDKQGELQPGLRSVARGFDAASGYDLRKISEWSPSQKARVTRYFHELDNLTAQPRKIYRPKNRANLKLAQQYSGHNSGFQFKVALVPYTPKKGSDTKVKITVSKEHGLRVATKSYAKTIVPLRPRELTRDPNKEIKHAAAMATGATRFAIHAGVNEMPGLFDVPSVTRMVHSLMVKYNGVDALPRGSGNRGDNPKHHKYTKWLNGLVAYSFANNGQSATATAAKDFEVARRDLQRRRRNMRVKAKRK